MMTMLGRGSDGWAAEAREGFNVSRMRVHTVTKDTSGELNCPVALETHCETFPSRHP